MDDTVLTKEGQIAFRAWHEWSHICHRKEFTPEQEMELAFIQAAELPPDWGVERMLVVIEITADILHFQKYGHFVDGRKQFTHELYYEGKFKER